MSKVPSVHRVGQIRSGHPAWLSRRRVYPVQPAACDATGAELAVISNGLIPGFVPGGLRQGPEGRSVHQKEVTGRTRPPLLTTSARDYPRARSPHGGSGGRPPGRHQVVGGAGKVALFATGPDDYRL